jgi:hypothetical protein
MVMSNQIDKQNVEVNKASRKIVQDDVEFKEKQFMDDEYQYYKTVKTKPRKRAHSDLFLNNGRRAAQKASHE